MNILYDHQIWDIQNYGGASRYFCELMNQFSKDTDIEFTIALRYSNNDNLRAFNNLNKHWSKRNDFFSDDLFFSAIQKKMHINFLNYLFDNKNESKRLLKRQDFDIFHPTYYDPYFLKYLRGKSYVITVHDMIHELFPEYFSIIDFTIAHKKQLLENADLIIAISENTKKDIVKFTNVDPDRIRVIYHGNPFERMTEFSPVNIITYPKIFEKPYVLFVGTRSIYKNFIFFITSVSVLLHKYDELHVCCAGGGPFTPREKQIFSKLNILHKVHYFQTNDYITKNLYLHAQLFIFPSLYEGFGLPVLEAFSCGCPAVLSNTSSLPEIGGDAAIYIEPDNAESIVQGIERVLFNQDVKEDLRRKGYNRLTLFSWEKTAFETKKVYDNLLYQ